MQHLSILCFQSTLKSEMVVMILRITRRLGLVDDFQMRLYQVWKQCHQLPNQQVLATCVEEISDPSV